MFCLSPRQGSGVPTFKLVLAGDGGTGKTTFMTRHRTGEFEKRYIATVGVDVHPLSFHTNQGKIAFNCWDCAGQEKFGGLRDGYYIQGQCAMVFCEADSRVTVTQVPNWVRDIYRVCGDIPIAIVCNKVDTPEAVENKDWIFRTMQGLMSKLVLGGGGGGGGGEAGQQQGGGRGGGGCGTKISRIAFFEVSVKSSFQFEAPFMWLAQQLTDSNELKFVETPALAS